MGPAVSAAKVDSAGTVQPLDGRAATLETVTAEDVQDDAKLAQMIGRLNAQVAELRRNVVPRRTDFEDLAVGYEGAATQVAHNAGGRVRWAVNGWQTDATPTTDNLMCLGTMWVPRGLCGPGTLASTAGSFTVGARFEVTSPCRISGARFLWRSSGAAKTVKATIWADASGAILASGTVTVNNSGLYTVEFVSSAGADGGLAISGALLNVNLTIGVWETSGGSYTSSGADAPFTNLRPMTVPGFILKNNSLFLAGDARPTTDGTGSVCYWVEPLLTPAVPQLIETSATDGNTLVLASYAAGKASLRVETAG